MLPLLVGHRGWPAHYPENSLVGFKAAIKQGIPAIELDVQISRDAVPFVIHDKNLQRTSLNEGDIHQLNSEQLKQMSIDEPLRFNKRYAPEYLCSLETVIELIKQHSQLQLFIEIKKEVFKHFDYQNSWLILKPLLSKAAQQITLISYDEGFLDYVKTHSLIKIGWVLTHYDLNAQLIAKQINPNWLICNCQKIPEDNSPLWPGKWQWMLYDIVDAQTALHYVNRGVDAIETWDFKRLADDLLANKITQQNKETNCAQNLYPSH